MMKATNYKITATKILCERRLLHLLFYVVIITPLIFLPRRRYCGCSGGEGGEEGVGRMLWQYRGLSVKF